MNPQPADEVVKHPNVYLYGNWGVGKTIVVCRYCQKVFDKEGKKGLLIATDSGTDSLWNHPELLDIVDVVPYDGLSQLSIVAEAITEDIEGYGKYGVVLVDTISQVQEEYQDWLLENYTMKNREVATPTKAGGKPEQITSLPDYMLTRDKMRGPIKDLIKAPVDVFFTAHLREPSFMDIQKAKLERRPTSTEQVFKLIARESSLLGFMEREGKDRTIQFKTDKKTVSKSRIASLDDKIVTDDEFINSLIDWKYN